jgi:hypothetical protein
MAYTDPILTVRSDGLAEGTSAAVIKISGGQTAGTPTFGEEYVLPGGGTVLEFGVVVQVTLGTQATTAPVVALHKGTKAGSGASGSEIATITPTAAAPAGSRFVSSSSSFPLRVKPGEVLVFRQKTAGNPNTGSYFCYAIVRQDGHGGANSVAPLTRKSA